jgi:hypothetical protein
MKTYAVGFLAEYVPCTGLGEVAALADLAPSGL